MHIFHKHTIKTDQNILTEKTELDYFCKSHSLCALTGGGGGGSWIPEIRGVGNPWKRVCRRPLIFKLQCQDDIRRNVWTAPWSTLITISIYGLSQASIRFLYLISCNFLNSFIPLLDLEIWGGPPNRPSLFIDFLLLFIESRGIRDRRDGESFCLRDIQGIISITYQTQPKFLIFDQPDGVRSTLKGGEKVIWENYPNLIINGTSV